MLDRRIVAGNLVKTVVATVMFPLATFATGACGSGSGGAPGGTGGAITAGGSSGSAGAATGGASGGGGTNDGGRGGGGGEAIGGGSAGAGGGIMCPTFTPGAPLPSGTAPPMMAAAPIASTPTRPQLSQTVADGSYSLRKVLAKGGMLTLTAGAIQYANADDWNPIDNGIGDTAKFVPVFTVAADGSGTHTTIQAAVTAAVAIIGCPRAYIQIVPGIYRERVLVPSKTSAPPITLYSTEKDASKTVIVSNASAASQGGISLSPTLAVNVISGFQMKNMTVANDYVEGSSSPEADQSAVAMLTQGDRAQFENVRFLGNISTLYVKSLSVNMAARAYFRDCYVEGDNDIIFGRGTAVFDHTEVKVLAARQTSGGIIGAPSTIEYNPYGFLFDSCQFTTEPGVTAISLARQWLESGNPQVIGKMVVRNSVLGAHLAGAKPWSTADNRTTTPKNPAGSVPISVFSSDDYFAAGMGPTPPEPYLAEFGNSGPGAQP